MKRLIGLSRTQAASSATPAPEIIESTRQYARVGDSYTATYAVCGYPAEVDPGWLDPLLSQPGRIDVAIHTEPVTAPIAAQLLKRQRARLESSRRLDADRGRLGDPGVDAAAEDAADLAERVARGASRLFHTGIYITIHARSLGELNATAAAVQTAAAGALLDLQPVTFRHQQGWESTRPFGVDRLGLTRVLDTEALAASFPFAGPGLTTPLPGTRPPTDAILYGVTSSAAGVLMWNRWRRDNHNSVILARSGAGKSYFGKLEVLRSLYQGVKVIVIDPEDEYRALADHVGGNVIQLGETDVKINPFDLPIDRRRPDTLTRRGVELHAILAAMLGRSDAHAYEPVRHTIDRAITTTYASAGITSDPATWTRPAPLMADLAAVLAGDPEPAGRELAGRLTPWITGNLSSLFDGPGRAIPHNHLVVWSLRHLPDELRPVAMLLALTHIWSSIDEPSDGATAQRCLVVVDEAWQLMRDVEGAKFLARTAKSFRKRRAGLSVISQDTVDFLDSPLGQIVLANAATQILMRQAPQAIEAIRSAFQLTGREARLLLTADRGEGLLVAGRERVGFRAVASPVEHQLALTGLGLNEA
ncbi:type IV secretory pathway VirB4 component [Hamadaea flava]|uniref:VirB4 family type IV secretion system protein n=1 Tax=Hamadaea flava TaxID=1742688 RepID=A0ABV8LDP8_9ACTN|nr:DUF87 domain-containing protein [Hamadaea flava]MCP2323398.1 type IV secretory pathway VirB4 component [Hamadaea flava]